MLLIALSIMPHPEEARSAVSKDARCCSSTANLSWGLCAPINLLELRVGVLDHLLGRGAGAGLGEHVDDDVFGDALGQLTAGRRRPAQEVRVGKGVAVGDVARL